MIGPGNIGPMGWSEVEARQERAIAAAEAESRRLIEAWRCSESPEDHRRAQSAAAKEAALRSICSSRAVCKEAGFTVEEAERIEWVWSRMRVSLIGRSIDDGSWKEYARMSKSHHLREHIEHLEAELDRHTKLREFLIDLVKDSAEGSSIMVAVDAVRAAVKATKGEEPPPEPDEKDGKWYGDDGEPPLTDAELGDARLE